VRKVLSIVPFFAAGLAALLAGRAAVPRSMRRLDSLTGLELRNAKGDVVTYRGRRAVRLLEPDPTAGGAQATEPSLAIVTGPNFKDGTIEAEVAGLPRGGASETARGFIGIVFRVQPHAAGFEAIYLRPTNGRADDQIRRNHSTQYISYPQYPWERLRKEAPGVYESYVDLEPGVWTRIKITVSGHRARLSVNGASQPCLIVNDLKLGETAGQVALWIGPETEGYFSSLSVQSE
jgi:hypothetical protein